MNKLLRLGRRVLSRSVESPCVFVEHGHEKPDPTVKIEEEHMPAYEKGLFYPVHIGQISTFGIKSCPNSGTARIPPSGSVVICCMNFLVPLQNPDRKECTKDTQCNKPLANTI